MKASERWSHFDFMFDAICVVDPSFYLDYANESFRSLFDLPRRSIGAKVPISELSRFPSEVAKFVAEETNSEEQGYREIEAKAAGGDITRLQARIEKYDLGNGEHKFIVLLKDINAEFRLHTKYKVQMARNQELIEDLQRHLQETAFLHRIVTEFSPLADTTQFLTWVTRELENDLGYLTASLFRLDNPPFPALTGMHPQQNNASETPFGQRYIDVESDSADQSSFHDSSHARVIHLAGDDDQSDGWYAVPVSPRLDNGCWLLVHPAPSEKPVDHSRFMSALSTQLGTLIDNRTLYLAACTDSLTGVYNRRFFESRLRLECSTAIHSRTDLTLLLFDLDLFKKLNDTYGHPAGDATLKTFAKMLQELTTETDIVARMGGEEFAILLPGRSPSEGAQVAERIRATLESSEILIPSAERVKITTSIGLSNLILGHCESPEDLYKAADVALYSAKTEGRNRIGCAPDRSRIAS